MWNYLDVHFKKESLRPLAVVFAIKFPLFLLFAYYFHAYSASNASINYFFTISGDTRGYYFPCEQFFLGNGYTSVCRMPGLLPIYYCLRVFCSPAWTQTIIVFLQFIGDAVATYLLAQIAWWVSKNAKAFWLVLIGYSLSYFVAVWNHVGYSDSFAVSMLISSVYFLLKFKRSDRFIHLMLSALLLTWSVFFRPLHGLLVPIYLMFFLLDYKRPLASLKTASIFLLPLIFFLGLWTLKNYRQTGRIIILQDSMSSCSSSIPPQMLAMRELIIAWGEDIQPWTKGSAAAWFFLKRYADSRDASRLASYQTSSCSLDSLIALKYNFHASRTVSNTASERKAFAQIAIDQSRRFLQSYRMEHPVRAYFFNRLILLTRFLLPSRLDNLPLPSFDQMSLFQKSIKIFYYFFLLAINLFGFLACLYFLYKKHYLVLVPLFFLIGLPVFFGYIEQRYLTPVYPFFLLFSVLACLNLSQLLNNDKLKSTRQ